MSLSPNSKILASRTILKNEASLSTTVGMHIATIGKDSVPVAIIPLPSANDLAHRKAAAFSNLVANIHHLEDEQSTAEIIQFITVFFL